MIYRFTGAATSGGGFITATDATAAKIGFGTPAEVTGPIEVRATVPAQYTISGLDNTVVVLNDPAPTPAPVTASPTVPTTARPTTKPTMARPTPKPTSGWFGLRQ